MIRSAQYFAAIALVSASCGGEESARVVDIEPGREWRIGDRNDEPRSPERPPEQPPREPTMPPPAPGPEYSSPYYAGVPGEGLRWFQFPAQQQDSDPRWGEVLADIVNHLPESYGSTYYSSDQITWAHETSHGIHSHLRNNFNDTGRRANAFYIPGGKAVIVEEPGIRKSDVAAYVPRSLRGSRFSTYITGQTAWDDTPLYVFDEWNAYINGGACGVDLAKQGLWTRGWRDGVAGQLELTVYALALAMAVEAGDPTYFSENVTFRELLAFEVKRAIEIFSEGASMPAFAWDDQDRYYQTLRESADAEAMRTFARRLFGENWANRFLFGFTN
jgi:hypothetical protein